MKNYKKLPRKQLEKFSTVFMQLGLVLTLFIVLIAIEHKTEVKEIAVSIPESTDEQLVLGSEVPIIYIKKEEIPKKKIIKQKPIVQTLDEIEKLDNDAKIETIIKEPVDIDPEIVDVDAIEEIEEEEVIECGVPFMIIEEIPTFKGCDGLSREESMKCFEKGIKKFFTNNFNGELASDVGLRSGKHKIFAQFLIDKDGTVNDIKIKAPHIALQKETKRVIQKLPRFKPGKQRGKPVKVKYTLPVSFNVE